MLSSPKKATLFGLLVLLFSIACSDTNCGGCVAPLSEPFPGAPRVYDGVQLRVERSGFDFIQSNLAVILDTLLEDGLAFEIPPQQLDLIVTDVDICETPCPLEIEIVDTYLSLVPTQTIGVDAIINVDGEISMDTTIIFDIHCDFPLILRDKPVSAQVILKRDTDSDFFYFEIESLELTIENSDYDIDCPEGFDQIMEALKDELTILLNTALKTQIDSAVSDLIAEQTCLPCDFYTDGCPDGSSCNGDGFCESGGNCLIKPLGLVGTLDLGQQLESVDPTNDATADLMIALGQSQPHTQQAFVRNNGLELRIIGGTYSDLNSCLPEPDPSDIPPVGLAPGMNFSGIIPGTGETYMVGVAIADKYLDHFFYQLWRSGLLCLAIDSYGVDQISSQTLGMFLPSLNLVTDNVNLPVRLEIRPQGVPYMEVGAGTFLQDGSIDEPILFVFLPEFRMDFWLRMNGRWMLFLSLLQDIRIDLGIEFTPDNQVIPILDENSVVVDNVLVSSYELLAEDEDTLKGVVPQLVGMFLPMLTDTMGEIEIPNLQGFILDIKSVEGNLERGSTGYYDFMSIYAGLSFEVPPPSVVTKVRLGSVGPRGMELEVLDADTEIQYRIDGGIWSPFKLGPRVRVNRWLAPGDHVAEVRARLVGDYRTLDPEPVCIPFESKMKFASHIDSFPLTGHQHPVYQALDSAPSEIKERHSVGCSTGEGVSLSVGLLLLLATIWNTRLRRRLRKLQGQGRL